MRGLCALELHVASAAAAVCAGAGAGESRVSRDEMGTAAGLHGSTDWAELTQLLPPEPGSCSLLLQTQHARSNEADGCPLVTHPGPLLSC